MLHLPFYSVIERQADERRAAKREREELESIARAKRDNLRAIVQKQELEQAVLRIQSRYRGMPLLVSVEVVKVIIVIAKRAREQGKEYMRLVCYIFYLRYRDSLLTYFLGSTNSESIGTADERRYHAEQTYLQNA